MIIQRILQHVGYRLRPVTERELSVVILVECIDIHREGDAMYILHPTEGMYVFEDGKWCKLEEDL